MLLRLRVLPGSCQTSTLNPTPGGMLAATWIRENGIVLPNNQRQHRTLHIQKDVLPYAVCYLL